MNKLWKVGVPLVLLIAVSARILVSSLHAAQPALKLPFEPNKTWEIIQGYNNGSHGNTDGNWPGTEYEKYAFDLAIYDESQDGLTEDQFVLAAAEGTVVWPADKSNPDCNHSVAIRHDAYTEPGPKYYFTEYAHMREIYVQRGDTVKQGDRIGKAGDVACGMDVPAHIHFSLFSANNSNGNKPRTAEVFHNLEGRVVWPETSSRYNWPFDGSGNQYKDWRIQSTQGLPDPKQASDLVISPSNPQVNQAVTFSFSVRNHGGSSITFQNIGPQGTRQGTSSSWDAFIPDITVAAGETREMSVSRSFLEAGTWTVDRITYQDQSDGSWHDLPADGFVQAQPFTVSEPPPEVCCLCAASCEVQSAQGEPGVFTTQGQAFPTTTPSPAATPVPTKTAIPTATPTNTTAPTNTPSPTSTSTATATPTQTVAPTKTPTLTPTAPPTAQPTATSTKTATPTPDTSPPYGSLAINGGAGETRSLNVTLRLAARDEGIGVTQMRFSRDGINWTTWENYKPIKPWQFPAEGPHTIYVQYRDAAGNVSEPSSATITVNLNVEKPSSESYRILSSVVGIGGGQKSSTNYQMQNTTGQPSSIAWSDESYQTSQSYQLSLGYWGISPPASVIPSLPGDVNCDGLVNSVDALFILQNEVGMRGTSNECPPPADTLYLAACDVSGDGNCNSIDALFILQCEVGTPNVLCPQGSTGSWLDSVHVPPSVNLAEIAQTATVSIGSGFAIAGSSMTVPLVVSGVENLGAVTIEARYNPAVISASACNDDPGGVFDSALCNPDFDNDGVNPDAARFTAISTSGVSGDVLLAELTFQTMGDTGVSSDLVVEVSVFADTTGDVIPHDVENGEITVVPCLDFVNPSGVGEEDIEFMADLWHQSAGTAPECDGNNFITTVDIMCVVAHLGETCP